MKECSFELIENAPLTIDVHRLTLRGDTSAITRPGQFVNVRIDELFLRRPLAVCDVDGDRLTLLCRTAGKGTETLCSMNNGKLNLLTGLGNGFDPTLAGNAPLLVAGGIGLAPLYFLCKELDNARVILGFNTADEVMYMDEFITLGIPVTVATADGSYGVKGFPTDVMRNMRYSHLYVCGPEAMLKAVHAVAETDGQYSFEARMGCGFGACMGCTCRTITGNKRICREGPVLKGSELLW